MYINPSRIKFYVTEYPYQSLNQGSKKKNLQLNEWINIKTTDQENNNSGAGIFLIMQL